MISFDVSVPALHTQMYILNETFKCQLFKIQVYHLQRFYTASHLQFFVSSLGQFSSQSVQSLLDRAVH